MVRLHENQEKELLKKVGVPVPRGIAASTPQEAKHVADEIRKPMVVKAQIWATGRFQAMGMKLLKPCVKTA